ncbi:hypothetical protein [Endozoicomonas sp. ISHI1]|nr:hypothetical protein [Endozoicomonas sp. ISHI1]
MSTANLRAHQGVQMPEKKTKPYIAELKVSALKLVVELGKPVTETATEPGN